MNRADRRKQERQQQKVAKKQAADAARQLDRDVKRDGIFDAEAALNNPAYMAQVKKQREAQRAQLEKNGITQEDLKREFDAGYAAGRKDAEREYDAERKRYGTFVMRMFYSALCISLHRLFKFGETRIVRALEDVQWIMTEEICTDDIIARCKAETGIDICNGDYDS